MHSMIITYAQGMAQLRTASKVYEYDLKLEDVARIWRGGCIIRCCFARGYTSRIPCTP